MAFNGIIPALLTPYDDDNGINVPAIHALVDRLTGDGIGGLFVCGSTGEWWLLSEAERMEIAETAVKAAAGRTRVMVHVGATSTASVVRLAQHAEKIGADAISALPPVGFSYPPECIWEHFKAIGASCALPLYLYHLPQVHGDLITIDRFVEAIDEIPTLAGAKFSSYRIDDMIDLRLKAAGRLNVISGCGEQLLSATACGADGSICTWYNLFPRLANKVVECVRSGRLEEARECEDMIVAFGKLCIGKAMGWLKYLVGRRGIECGTPRLPLPQITEQDLKETLPKVEATGALEWAI